MCKVNNVDVQKELKCQPILNVIQKNVPADRNQNDFNLHY